MLELLGGNLSDIDGRHWLCGLRCGNLVELARSVGVEHLRALRVGHFLVCFGRLCLFGMRRGKLCFGCRGVELCGVRLRPICGGCGFFDLHRVRCGPIPNNHQCYCLRELPGGPICNGVGGEHECLLNLRGRPVSDLFWGNHLRRLRFGHVRHCHGPVVVQ